MATLAIDPILPPVPPKEECPHFTLTRGRVMFTVLPSKKDCYFELWWFLHECTPEQRHLAACVAAEYWDKRARDLWHLIAAARDCAERTRLFGKAGMYHSARKGWREFGKI